MMDFNTTFSIINNGKQEEINIIPFWNVFRLKGSRLVEYLQKQLNTILEREMTSHQIISLVTYDRQLDRNNATPIIMIHSVNYSCYLAMTSIICKENIQHFDVSSGIHSLVCYYTFIWINNQCATKRLFEDILF